METEIDLLYSLIADKEVAITDLKSLLQMAKDKIDQLEADIITMAKAGLKEVVGVRELALQEGRKEAVDWVEERYPFYLLNKGWQEQKKKWGIE